MVQYLLHVEQFAVCKLSSGAVWTGVVSLFHEETQ